MELTALIDRLDDLVANAKKARRSGDVRIERSEAYAIVDQLRGAIPDELRQAHWIAENRDEMLGEARRERERILAEAREERARLLGGEAIERATAERARRLAEDAERRAREIRRAGDDYAGELLASLEASLASLRAAVERGRGRLAERGGERVAERGGEQGARRDAALVA